MTEHAKKLARANGSEGTANVERRFSGLSLISQGASIVVLFLYMVADARLSTRVGGTLVHPLEIAFIGVLFSAYLLQPSGLFRARVASSGVWLAVTPLWLLLVILPAIGILANLGGIASLYAMVTALVPFATLTIAGWSKLQRKRAVAAVFVAILVHGTYGVFQLGSRLKLVPGAIGSRISAWDISSQGAEKEAYIVAGRSTGLFLNANSFGLWSVFAILWAHFFLRGPARFVALSLGIAGVWASQSRTAWIVAGILGFLWLIAVARGSLEARRTSVGLVVLGTVFLVAVLSGAGERLLESDLLNRLGSALKVLSEGLGADRNLAARFDSWREAWEFSGSNPSLLMGTLGPPEQLFGGYIDNQYVSYFLQGSLPLVAAFVWALALPWFASSRGVGNTAPLKVMAVAVAVSSLTMLPYGELSVICVYWLAVASVVARHFEDRKSLWGDARGAHLNVASR